MAMNVATIPSTIVVPVNTEQYKLKITVFHCFNTFNNIAGSDSNDYDVHVIKMPCSSMTREVFLLRAFEAGADAVIVMVCPDGSCQYMEGNIRAGKRVARMKKLLDEIGLDGRRLSIFQVPRGDQSAVERIINQAVSDLVVLGPNPAT
jgi:F420-non-reducing hydrogenase iron-sulfur subunit